MEMKNRINNIVKKSEVLSMLKRKYFKKKWRKLNKHNFTCAKNCFNSKKVRIGNATYGELDIRHFGNSEEELVVGNYCSIAPESVFLLGGEHSYDKLSTYPFDVKYGEAINESVSRGPIIIEDDVWIGFRSTILSGVKVGQGAIIAAGAVVVKDIPPYAIVGGVPARVIKYRFSENIIQKLCSIDYCKIKEDKIKEYLDILHIVVQDDNVEEIVRELEVLAGSEV